VEKIKSYIRSIGFFNHKAKYIYETCKILNENDSKIPENIEELTKLP
jgi:endonuclease III